MCFGIEDKTAVCYFDVDSWEGCTPPGCTHAVHLGEATTTKTITTLAWQAPKVYIQAWQASTISNYHLAMAALGTHQVLQTAQHLTVVNCILNKENPLPRHHHWTSET